jgi:hypothetical protein
MWVWVVSIVNINLPFKIESLMNIIQNERNIENSNFGVVLDIIANHKVVLDTMVNKEPK